MENITYREQNPSQRLTGTPLSGGALFQLLKSRNRHFDIGGLVEFLASELLRVPKLRSVKLSFSLLNFTTTFNKRSHGYLDTPPEVAWPANQICLFTFSITPNNYDLETLIDDDIGLKLHPSNSCSVWGSESMDYCTIGLSSTKATVFGLHAIFQQEAEYLYNIVGAVLKNLARSNSFGLFKRDFEQFYQKPTKQYADWLLNKPLLQLMKTVPYPYWVFSRQLWYHGPNILHPKQVTAETSLYWFTYLNNATNTLTQSDTATKNIYGIGTQGRQGMARILVDSILSFEQAIKQGDLEVNEKSDLLAPLILQGMVYEGDTQIIGKEDDVQAIVDMFGKKMVEWSNILSRPVSVAEKLIRNDSQLANLLLGEVEMEDEF